MHSPNSGSFHQEERKMREDSNSYRIRLAFTATMAVIAFFLGFAPVLLGYMAKTFDALPLWLQLVIRIFPIQLGYLCAAIIPAWTVQPEIPLLKQLDLTQPERPYKIMFLIAAGTLLLYPLLCIMTFSTRFLLHSFNIPAPPQELAILVGKTGNVSLLVIISAGVLLAPVGEELAFRHVIYKQFARIAPPAGAACVSAFLFAASHFNALTFPSLFLLALYLQFIYIKTNSLLCAVYAHLLYNAVTIVTLLLLRYGISL